MVAAMTDSIAANRFTEPEAYSSIPPNVNSNRSQGLLEAAERRAVIGEFADQIMSETLGDHLEGSTEPVVLETEGGDQVALTMHRASGSFSGVEIWISRQIVTKAQQFVEHPRIVTIQGVAYKRTDILDNRNDGRDLPPGLYDDLLFVLFLFKRRIWEQKNALPSHITSYLQ